jgi:elongation factor P
MVLNVDGAPHTVEDFHTTGAAQTRHKVNARLRNLHTGRHVDRAFTENDRLTVIDLDTRHVLFSYRQGDDLVFSDVQTYEEITVPAGQVGDRQVFLRENEEYRALLLEGKLLEIVLPDHVAMAVVETGAPQKGVADATWKPARVEGGLEVLVPPFIAVGDVVRVDTRDRKYLRKESAG